MKNRDLDKVSLKFTKVEGSLTFMIFVIVVVWINNYSYKN